MVVQKNGTQQNW